MNWRPIQGHPDYEVSIDGRVRRSSSGKGAKAGHILAPHTTADGYLRIGLRHDGRHCNHRIHRLVAVAFLGPPPSNRHQVNHKDGDKTNNQANNLEWTTCRENILHAQQLGLRRIRAAGQKTT